MRSRDAASADLRASFRRFSNNALARVMAGWISSALRSCRVTVMPRSAAHAAMSPPMTPAPITCRWRNSAVGFAAQALEPVLQQEYPHEVARGLRAHELRDGARLGLVALVPGGAVVLPQIDDGVGSGIVLVGHLPAQRGRRLAGDEGTHGLEIQQLLDERRRFLGRRLEQHPFRGRLELLRRHELIDQSEFEALSRL